MSEVYDYIILGAGPGGYEIAADLANEGKKVAIVEKNLPGGTCLNRGCIPTKCLCASAERALALSEDAEFGVVVGDFNLDYSKAVERMRKVVDGLRDNVRAVIGKCDLFEGEGVLMPGRKVKVGENIIEGHKIFIATGSKPASLPIPGAELAVDSDKFLALDELPKRLCIVGGGVIGMEFASIAAAFGCEVTVVEYCKEILPPFDKDIAKRLRSQLSRRGVKTIVGAAVKAIGEGMYVEYEGKKGLERVDCDMVLIAVGRRPVLPQGCEEAGVKVSPRGFVETDERMMTSAEGIYAIGDVNGRCMLAHAASAQARVAAGMDVNLDIIPSAVFTTPEAAMVGLTEDQCKTREINYKVGKNSYASNGKALAMGEGEGTVKMIFDPESRQILGCHILGAHASDLVAEVAAAMFARTTVDEIRVSLVHGHPTLSEIILRACN